MSKNRLIINADDCGISDVVNAEIRRCIEDGIITSTTVMANMPAFEGAVALYRDFHPQASFGIHYNLTEGHPLRSSQLLLDNGYYVERDGAVWLNAKNFAAHLITEQMKSAIMDELREQTRRILDAGIVPSHIDSHHHVHWRLEYLPLFCKLAGEYSIKRMRREYNYGGHPSLKNQMRRRVWKWYMKWHNMHLVCPDAFTDIFPFFKQLEAGLLPKGKTFELMCHPGHRFQQYKDEMTRLYHAHEELEKGLELISYYKI